MHFSLIAWSWLLLWSNKVKQPQSQRSDSKDKMGSLGAGIEKHCKLGGSLTVFLDSSWEKRKKPKWYSQSRSSKRSPSRLQEPEDHIRLVSGSVRFSAADLHLTHRGQSRVEGQT